MTEGVRSIWNRYKYAALVILLGVVLMIWPVRTGRQTRKQETRDIQREMEEILSRMAGVGQVRVMLTEESDGERQLAENTDTSFRGSASSPEDYSKSSEPVLVDGTGGKEPLVTRTVYPTWRGALVVCQGGDRAAVRLAVTKAVSALTGLSADRVAVEKWQ